MNNNKLSICCLGYNHATFLQECLNAIAQIDYPDIEVIAVDDGSQDNSVETLNSMIQDFPFPLKVITQNNTGNIGKNFNTALNQSNGELVAFIALDDVFYPQIIQTEIDMMLADEHLAFVAPKKALAVNQDGWVLDSLPPLPIENTPFPDLNTLLECEYAHFGAFYIQGCIFRKSVIDAIGGFDEDMTGDDIVLRTKLFRYIQAHPEWRYAFVPQNSVFYRLHDNNIHKNGLRQIRIVTEYLARYWPDRPNPELLTDWALGVVNQNNLNDFISALQNMNPHAAALLQDQRMQKKIKKLSFRRNPIIQTVSQTAQKCLFRREKISPSQRKITLFGCISFCYDKMARQHQNHPPVHYSTFFSQDK